MLNSLLQLFYPQCCEGCAVEIYRGGQLLCGRCQHELPETKFFGMPGNPVEQLFYGRCRVEHAGAAFYFTKHALLQHLLKELKYRRNRECGHFLGRMIGRQLADSERFENIELLVPLPLSARKEFTRGYNQANLICEGIAQVWKRPVAAQAVERLRFTESQTGKDRLERWQNMESVFGIRDRQLLEGRHLLLVDDVVTTGATLEACAAPILAIPGTRLSIAAAAYTAL
jgi:ComF family protein